MKKVNCSPKEYEKIVQEIYQDLLDKQNVYTKVMHNVKIKGKSGASHQLDVFYMIESIRYSVIIGCKNWNHEVGISQVKILKATMEDIAATKGFLVTSIGYQSGAKIFAESCGIELKRVNSPKEIDWDGLIKIIKVNMQLLHPNVNFSIDPDFEYPENKKNVKIIKDYTGGTSLNINDVRSFMGVIFCHMKNNQMGMLMKMYFQKCLKKTRPKK